VAFAVEVRRHTDALRDRHFAFHDGRNTARVYSAISDRLDAR
jgi:hypothetical protein